MNTAGTQTDLSDAKMQETEALLRYEQMLRVELVPSCRENPPAEVIQASKATNADASPAELRAAIFR